MKSIHACTLLTFSVKASCETFDYVIAGAGTCGLVLANRLSEDPKVKVAVIEPGEDVRNNPNVTDIGAFTTAFNTSIDWQYVTAPQSEAGNRPIAYHAGKAIGGTSTINGMTYIRGDKAEFDAWEALGNGGWNWDTMYPYFKMVEQFSPPTTAQVAAGATYEAEYHGDSGPLDTGYPFQLLNGTFYETVQETWDSLGYPLNHEVNSGDVHGFSAWPQTLDRDANVRQDAARAYYYPVEDRPNLSIIKGTVTRLTWANSSLTDSNAIANGVEYLTQDGQSATISASKEVILSAGALRSPLILERSGVGDPTILDGLDIDLKVALPGVGEHLQDQPNTALTYAGTLNATGTTPYATFVTVQDIFGNETSAIAESTKAKLSDWAQQGSTANRGAIGAEAVERMFRIQHDLIFNQNVTIGETLTAVSSSYLVSAFWLLLPFSIGNVHLPSAEAINSPAIDPKYFFIDFDLDVQVALGRLSQEFWYTQPVGDLVTANVIPGVAALPRNATDAQWKSFFESTLTPNHHPIGTASMMSRELGGVVDPELRVYGTGNVRVVDASVLPMQISGHLTATLYAVAERAAEFIKSAA